MISRILILFAVVGLACAAIWQGRLPEKPSHLAHKQGCYIGEINDVIPFGESYTNKEYCYAVGCSEDMLYYESCGKVATRDPICYVTQDLSKSYPGCCPEVKCEKKNSSFKLLTNNTLTELSGQND